MKVLRIFGVILLVLAVTAIILFWVPEDKIEMLFAMVTTGIFSFALGYVFCEMRRSRE